MIALLRGHRCLNTPPTTAGTFAGLMHMAGDADCVSLEAAWMMYRRLPVATLQALNLASNSVLQRLLTMLVWASQHGFRSVDVPSDEKAREELLHLHLLCVTKFLVGTSDVGDTERLEILSALWTRHFSQLMPDASTCCLLGCELSRTLTSGHVCSDERVNGGDKTAWPRQFRKEWEPVFDYHIMLGIAALQVRVCVQLAQAEKKTDRKRFVRVCTGTTEANLPDSAAGVVPAAAQPAGRGVKGVHRRTGARPAVLEAAAQGRRVACRPYVGGPHWCLGLAPRGVCVCDACATVCGIQCLSRW